MTTVREIMTTDPITVETSTTLREAAQKMRDADVGDLLVEEDGNLRGLLTDRDITIRCIAEGIDPESATVDSILSEELHTLSPDSSVKDAIQIMREQAVRRVPIVEEGSAVGVLSIGDLAVIEDPDSALADISASQGNE